MRKYSPDLFPVNFLPAKYPKAPEFAHGQRWSYFWMRLLLPPFVLLFLSVTVQAQFTYTTANNQITITGYTGSGGAVSIPATINGLPVTSIGANAFLSKSSLTSVIIPVSVTSIGQLSFLGCNGLSSVTIPASVTSIGQGAFYACRGLTSVTIPASVTSIGNDAFSRCTSLPSITVDPANSAYMNSSDGLLFNKNQTTLLQCPGGKTGSYTIPNTVTSIKSGSFFECTRLTSVTIPASVTNIQSSAFASCTSLPSITVDPANSVYMNSSDGLLFNKNQTTLLQCPGGKTGSYTIPNGVTSILDFAFNGCAGLTSVSIPSGVTSIGSYTFQGCASLTSVAIPNGVTSIGQGAFSHCTGLASAVIPPSVTSIVSFAFEYCTNLASVVIPSSVGSIQGFTFSHCTSLTSVTIPSGVTSVGDDAFNGCTKLVSSIFNGNAPSMGVSVFNSTSSGFAVYYFNGAAGFTSPTWQGYLSVNMGAYSPISTWLVSAGLSYNADLTTAPNGDGISLLMDYALNLNPAKNQSGRLPQPVVTGNQMSITYFSGNAGITYAVETSTDLITWSTAGVTITGPDASNNSTATITASGPSSFLRLVVHH